MSSIILKLSIKTVYQSNRIYNSPSSSRSSHSLWKRMEWHSLHIPKPTEVIKSCASSLCHSLCHSLKYKPDNHHRTYDFNHMMLFLFVAVVTSYHFKNIHEKPKIITIQNDIHRVKLCVYHGYYDIRIKEIEPVRIEYDVELNVFPDYIPYLFLSEISF